MLNEAMEDEADLRSVLEKYFLQVWNNWHCIFFIYSEDDFVTFCCFFQANLSLPSPSSTPSSHRSSKTSSARSSASLRSDFLTKTSSPERVIVEVGEIMRACCQMVISWIQLFCQWNITSQLRKTWTGTLHILIVKNSQIRHSLVFIFIFHGVVLSLYTEGLLRPRPAAAPGPLHFTPPCWRLWNWAWIWLWPPLLSPPPDAPALRAAATAAAAAES